jgi:hypothetical protein
VTPFDYKRYLDLVRRHDQEFMRLRAWEHLAAERSWHYEHQKQRFDRVPYARTGPGLACDGKPKLDLRQLNPEYFERRQARGGELLRRLVRSGARRG